VKIEAFSVNPVDTYLRAGANKDLPLPWVPGADAAGTVHSVGESAKNKIHVGQRVWLGGTAGGFQGCYSQFALCNVDNVWPLAETASFDAGGALWCAYGTAYQALVHIGEVHSRHARVVSGGKRKLRLLIHGASGGVGIASIQVARALIPDVEIFGTAGTEEGLGLLRSEGVNHAFNHRNPKYFDEIKALVNPEGIDIILEMLANVNLGKDLELLAPRGCVTIIGNRGGDISINPGLLLMKRADVRGMHLFNHCTFEERAEICAWISKQLSEAKLIPKIQKTYRLDEVKQAHIDITDPNFGSSGKLIVHPWL